jgi:branched-chain amino acid aminotransferase
VDEYVYLNGRIVPAAEARVSVFDAGFSHSAGLFETMRAYGGRVMRLRDHLDRLARSAGTLELQIPVDPAALSDAMADVLAANNLADARIRLTVTSGRVPRQVDPPEAVPAPTTLVAAEPVRAYPAELYRTGMRVCICPYKQNRLDPLCGHKTLAYLPRLLAMRDAAERKCQESLWFTTENRLAEGSVSNAFVVRDARLVTPPLDTPVLPGTVRKAVLELAGRAGMTVAEEQIDINALLAADEVFLTGSVLEIMPVTSIERHQVGKGVPGEVTRALHEQYRELVGRECAAA